MSEYYLPKAVRPSLKDLKERSCTLEELQLALVHLIEIHNKNVKETGEKLERKKDKEWRATL